MPVQAGGFGLGFFKDMSDSAINFSRYRYFANLPWKRVITYLLLMVLVLGIPVLLSIAYDFQRDMTKVIEQFNKNAPDFVLKNGELTVAGEMPLVYESGNQDSAIIIDTSGETDSSVLDDYEQGFFIEKTKLVFKRDSLETQEYHFSALKELELEKADVVDILSYLRPISAMIVFFGLIYFIFAKLCTVSILSLVTLLFSGIQNCGLNYGQSFKITVYAMTIPTLFQSLQNIIAPGFIYGWAIYYSIAVIYLLFAVRSTKSKPVASDEDLLV